ncbi:MAG: hypothetical protein HZA88_20535 [Verrucomicrobia bacterium]|nr:hypothetical protein [Verrucomicrobiota bacterium]
MTLKPRLLFVEDEKHTRIRFQRVLSAPEQKFADVYQLPSFDVTTAATGHEAQRRLAEAIACFNPYDVLALDLGLPREDPQGEPDMLVGLDVLRNLDERSSLAVVVPSVHYETSTLVELLRVRPVHFVPKPYTAEELIRSVAEAYRFGQKHLAQRVGLLNEQRMRTWHVVQGRAQIADNIARLVSKGMGSVLHRLEQLEDLLHDRYQLDEDRDHEDPVCEALMSLRDTVAKVSQPSLNGRETCARRAETQDTVIIEDVLEQALQELWPLIAYRRLSLTRPSARKHSIHTFRHYITMLVQELVFNAAKASAQGANLRIAVMRDGETETLNVDIVDSAPVIPSILSTLIHNGDPLAVGDELTAEEDRGWGLSLVQRVANNIGARISIAPEKSGNRVTLHIPLTARD